MEQWLKQSVHIFRLTSLTTRNLCVPYGYDTLSQVVFFRRKGEVVYDSAQYYMSLLLNRNDPG